VSVNKPLGKHVPVSVAQTSADFPAFRNFSCWNLLVVSWTYFLFCPWLRICIPLSPTTGFYCFSHIAMSESLSVSGLELVAVFSATKRHILWKQHTQDSIYVAFPLNISLHFICIELFSKKTIIPEIKFTLFIKTDDSLPLKFLLCSDMWTCSLWISFIFPCVTKKARKAF
jgi:hypothetical protein